MEPGVIGFPGPLAVQLVEVECSLGKGFVTVHHRPMEESLAT